jgi:DNA-binding TFAR19-related protein (PDSD5 family)
MKIRSVKSNERRGCLELTVHSGKTHSFPYARLDPRPAAGNRVRRVYVDRELGSEAVTYELESGDEGSVHIEQALEHEQDPRYMAELLLHELTVAARRRLESSALTRRDLARRLGTSAAQLYRLLDPSNTTKSINQLVGLLHVLDCDVRLVVRPRRAA